MGRACGCGHQIGSIIQLEIHHMLVLLCNSLGNLEAKSMICTVVMLGMMLPDVLCNQVLLVLEMLLEPL